MDAWCLHYYAFVIIIQLPLEDQLKQQSKEQHNNNQSEDQLEQTFRATEWETGKKLGQGTKSNSWGQTESPGCWTNSTTWWKTEGTEHTTEWAATATSSNPWPEDAAERRRAGPEAGGHAEGTGKQDWRSHQTTGWGGSQHEGNCRGAFEEVGF